MSTETGGRSITCVGWSLLLPVIASVVGTLGSCAAPRTSTTAGLGQNSLDVRALDCISVNVVLRAAIVLGARQLSLSPLEAHSVTGWWITFDSTRSYRDAEWTSLHAYEIEGVAETVPTTECARGAPVPVRELHNEAFWKSAWGAIFAEVTKEASICGPQRLIVDLAPVGMQTTSSRVSLLLEARLVSVPRRAIVVRVLRICS